jgi:hypothetical protein
MTEITTRRLVASAMVGAALLATAGFSWLGAVFDYPAVLDEPTADLLAAYRQDQAAVTVGFALLFVAAALLAPIGLLLGRVAATRRGAIGALGVAAAAVQVIGLSRWLLLVPGISRDALDPARTADAHHRFTLAHSWLGHAVGETLGYALTAAFTIVAVGALTGLARWVRGLGAVAAVLVATGVLVPLGVDAAELTNFAGYLLWTAWLVAVAVALVRRGAVGASPRTVTTAAVSAAAPPPVGRT